MLTSVVKESKTFTNPRLQHVGFSEKQHNVFDESMKLNCCMGSEENPRINYENVYLPGSMTDVKYDLMVKLVRKFFEYLNNILDVYWFARGGYFQDIAG